jgi:cytochrome P450
MGSHGSEHLKFRRAVNPLFARASHLWYRDAILMPALKRNLAELMQSGGGAPRPRADLLVFSRRLFAELAGSLVGFDGIQTREGAELLLSLHAALDRPQRQISEMTGQHAANPDRFGEIEELMALTLAARIELQQTFYRPSLERRSEMVAQQRDGRLADVELPRDFLTFVASGEAAFDESENPGAAFLMAINLFSGATGTSTQTLVHAVDHLERWFAAHPEDRTLDADPAFLEHALWETLRLRANGTIALPRLALADVALSNGRQIKYGQYVAILTRVASADPKVFGPDAAVFNPRRVVPEGVYPYGLGFGSGAHMCIGLPLVLGQGGITGTVVPTLRTLYQSGLRLDPARPPQPRREVWPFRQEFESFPVTFEPG